MGKGMATMATIKPAVISRNTAAFGFAAISSYRPSVNGEKNNWMRSENLTSLYLGSLMDMSDYWVNDLLG